MKGYDMKRMIRNLWMAMGAAVLATSLAACKQSGGQRQQEKWAVAESKTTVDAQSAVAQSADTAAVEAEQEPAYFTFSQAIEMVRPGRLTDEASIEKLFGDIGLPKIQAERYICDADWGGDTPAISYCWGNDVELKNLELTATADSYYGVSFSFFFDKSRKKGFIQQFDIITSSEVWYKQFMQDASAAKLVYIEDVDRAIYGKPGKIYQRKAGEMAFYYVFDFSADRIFNVQVGYDRGIDM